MASNTAQTPLEKSAPSVLLRPVAGSSDEEDPGLSRLIAIFRDRLGAQVEALLREFAESLSEHQAQVGEDDHPSGPQVNLLSVARAADRLGVGVSTVKTLIREARLESVKIGNRRLVPAEAIDAFVAELRLGRARSQPA